MSGKWRSSIGRRRPDMLARGIEGAVKKECEILGDQPQFHVFLAGGCPGEKLQCHRQPTIKTRRMYSETRRERVSEIRRHRCEDLAPDMALSLPGMVTYRNTTNR